MRDSLLTPLEVAEIFRVDDSTVRRWCAEGRIGAVKLPTRGFRISRAEVDRILSTEVIVTRAEALNEG
jgi:excisionase family DNA binding protein